MNEFEKYSLAAHARRLEEESERDTAAAEANSFREVLGESFEPFDSETNHEKIGRFVESMRWPVSARSLMAAFGILVSRGLLEREDAEKSEEPAAEKTEPRRDEHGKFAPAPEIEFRRFYDASTAAQIKARSQTDAKFSAWLRGEVQRNTTPSELPREPAAPVVLPASPPTELQEFAEAWRVMPLSEARRNLRNPDFVRTLDAATRAGLV